MQGQIETAKDFSVRGKIFFTGSILCVANTVFERVSHNDTRIFLKASTRRPVTRLQIYLARYIKGGLNIFFGYLIRKLLSLRLKNCIIALFDQKVVAPSIASRT